MSLRHVFEPIRIGSVEIPNRIVRTAHGTHFSQDSLTDEFIAYHEARARGGCGLSILEIASVHPSSVGTVRNFDDGIIPHYRRLMEAIRPHGMKIFQQLHHGGAHFPGLDGLGWSASDIPSPLGFVPRPMRQDDIDTLVEAFAAAALRCREGGLDGVEIHGAHGYIFHQFLSPLLNRRTDAYGGSLENRMRLLMDTARAVRKRVGQDFVVGVRLSATEAPEGVKAQDNVALIHALEAEGLIDYVNVSLGDYYRPLSMNATMETPTGYELPSAGPIAATSTLPRIVAGRFRTLEEAEQVLREGTADLISMVRAQIADPDLVRKTKEGHPEQVRPCIACNQGCIGQLNRGGRMGCLVNPAVGFERQLDDNVIAATPVGKRKVLVVGGGPAGMEAARVAALAGHEVILAEAMPGLGGAAAVARKAPYLHMVGDILYWLEQEVYRLGVDVRLNSYFSADDIRGEGADVVIIATGSEPRMDGMQASAPWVSLVGVDQPHVLSTIDLLTAAPAAQGRHALVLDDVGHVEAIAAVDTLMARGMAVTLVTRHPMMTPYVQSTLRTTPALERFGKQDFRLITRALLAEIGQGDCIVRPLDGGPDQHVPADVVVLVTYNRSRSDLFDELRGELPALHVIGDAASPRDMQAAIAEGRRVATSLG
nr:FAD-dependent oxidoreductase [Sphingomonas sp. CDS-1]